MRLSEHDFTVAQKRHDGEGTSGGGQQQSLPHLTHNDAAILRPTRTGDDSDLSHRDHGAAVHRHLVDLVASREADPLPVGREERPARSLRPREFGGRRLIQATGEQTCWRAGGVDQPRASGEMAMLLPALLADGNATSAPGSTSSRASGRSTGVFPRRGANNATPRPTTSSAAIAGRSRVTMDLGAATTGGAASAGATVSKAPSSAGEPPARCPSAA